MIGVEVGGIALAYELANGSVVLAAAEKTSDRVILSGAKDLLFVCFNEKQQMLRCAQHDRRHFSGACWGEPRARHSGR